MRSIRLIALGMGFWLASCGPLIRSSKVVEHRSSDVQGSKFKTLAVIGGDDTRPTLRMSAQVREQLGKEGLTAVRKAGRWSAQMEALEEICKPGGEQPIDGVVVVTYDRIALHDCQSKAVAYSIQGGARLGLIEMTDKLVQFLKSQS